MRLAMMVNGEDHQTFLDVECCVCGADMGTKEGHGQTGKTSGICSLECALTTIHHSMHEA
jgi:hypothetical protein